MQRVVKQSELQQDVERYTTRLTEALVEGMAPFEDADPKTHETAMRLTLVYASSALEIASGPAPEVSLFDMIVFVCLSLHAFESHWVPQFFGERGRPTVRALGEAETRDMEIWRQGTDSRPGDGASQTDRPLESRRTPTGFVSRRCASRFRLTGRPPFRKRGQGQEWPFQFDEAGNNRCGRCGPARAASDVRRSIACRSCCGCRRGSPRPDNLGFAPPARGRQAPGGPGARARSAPRGSLCARARFAGSGNRSKRRAARSRAGACSNAAPSRAAEDHQRSEPPHRKRAVAPRRPPYSVSAIEPRRERDGRHAARRRLVRRWAAYLALIGVVWSLFSGVGTMSSSSLRRSARPPLPPSATGRTKRPRLRQPRKSSTPWALGRCRCVLVQAPVEARRHQRLIARPASVAAWGRSRVGVRGSYE